MTDSRIDAALAAGNPLPATAAAGLPLRAAEDELIGAILALPVRTVRVRAHRRRRLLLALAAAAAVVTTIAVNLPGEQNSGPSPAFAAALVRFANASPLVLLELPGWRVVYADEQTPLSGEMHFARGPAAGPDGTPVGASYRNQASLVGRVAQLTWGPLDRAALKFLGRPTTPTGLGVGVRKFVPEGGSPHAFDISAFFVDHGRILDFRATVSSMAMFRTELRALTAVDTDTWLRAMPPSVVNAADSSETVRLMLKGIPLPPGFDAARIRGAHLVHDRYQLGAAVTGTVACMWIGDWNRARVRGDEAAVRRAIAAMATAPQWPILHEMARQGAWPQVLIGYARAMPAGTWAGRPLAGDVETGLGCGEWGVSLGPGVVPIGPIPLKSPG